MSLHIKKRTQLLDALDKAIAEFGTVKIALALIEKVSVLKTDDAT